MKFNVDRDTMIQAGFVRCWEQPLDQEEYDRTLESLRNLLPYTGLTKRAAKHPVDVRQILLMDGNLKFGYFDKKHINRALVELGVPYSASTDSWSTFGNKTREYCSIKFAIASSQPLLALLTKKDNKEPGRHVLEINSDDLFKK